ncbi:MAG: hypothetical protein ACYCW6_05760 [Candidatus Xenobia bacterium]
MLMRIWKALREYGLSEALRRAAAAIVFRLGEMRPSRRRFTEQRRRQHQAFDRARGFDTSGWIRFRPEELYVIYVRPEHLHVWERAGLVATVGRGAEHVVFRAPCQIVNNSDLGATRGL